VAGLTLPANISVKLIRQANAGCYPACNVALDNMGADTDYVAFLDSDDEWSDEHLANALEALEQGYDLYFSNFYQLNQTTSAFQRDERIALSDHKRIHPTKPIYEFANNLFDQIIRRNLLGTSTIAYNARKLGDLRYREDFRHTGAEYLLWLDMARRVDRVAFSAAAEVRYGGGVNIFAEAGWGTDKFLTVRQDEIKWRKHALARLPLTPDQRRHLRMKVDESRAGFCLGLIHNLRHNRKVAPKILSRQLQEDPWTFAALGSALRTGLTRRIKHER
jgi:succinoglycan biosynthesis protein ExoW